MTELDYTQEMYRKPSSKIEGYLNGSAAGNWGLACIITHITLDKVLVRICCSQQELFLEELALQHR